MPNFIQEPQFTPDEYLHPWWGEFHFDIGQSRAWRFGSLLLRISRKSSEWQVEYMRPKVQSEDDHEWEILESDYDFGTITAVQRYIFSHTTEILTLKPRLADRSIVVKPINQIFIPAGHEGSLYVSTPLWIDAYVPSQKTPLFDIPIARLQDTWFGRDTMRGEICYASPVFGRTQLEHLPPRPFRAVTRVIFHNRGNTQLELARMNLPVPSLHLLYSPSTKRLWTPGIEVFQESMSKASRVKIDQHTPLEAGPVILIDAPREGEGSGLLRMFEDWFE